MRSSVLFLLIVTTIGCGTGRTDGDSSNDQVFPVDGDLAGSHILISYAGAQGSDTTVTRTAEEAEAKAQDIIEALNADASRFSELARTESDDPMAASGGTLGAWYRGAMVPEFEAAVESLAVGQISQQPVETIFGYHIVRRDPLEKMHYGGSVFFISHKEVASQLAPSVTRSYEEAKTLADDLSARLTSDNFEGMARQFNDLGDGPLQLGAIKDGDNVPYQILEALKSVEYDEVAGPVEFPLGFAFVKRSRVVQYAGSHILISYDGAEGSRNPGRTREEAMSLAKEIAVQLTDDPGQFEAIAKERSDGPTGVRGGDLGTWFKGAMVEEFDAAIEGLDVGEITPEPVETMFGFHIIRRNALQASS